MRYTTVAAPAEPTERKILCYARPALKCISACRAHHLSITRNPKSVHQKDKKKKKKSSLWRRKRVGPEHEVWVERAGVMAIQKKSPWRRNRRWFVSNAERPFGRDAIEAGLLVRACARVGLHFLVCVRARGSRRRPPSSLGSIPHGETCHFCVQLILLFLYARACVSVHADERVFSCLPLLPMAESHESGERILDIGRGFLLAALSRFLYRYGTSRSCSLTGCGSKASATSPLSLTR